MEKKVIIDAKNLYTEQFSRRSYWIGMLVGSLPFFLVVTVFIAASARIVPFDQGMRLVLCLAGAEILAIVVCLLIRRLRRLGLGLFTSLFFTPVVLIGLGFIIVLVSGPVF